MRTRSAPGGEFQWQNKQVVHLVLPGQSDPWASIQTKKPDAVYLTLHGPKLQFTLGQILPLGHHPELKADRPNGDAVRLRFRTPSDLARGDLPAFLREHHAAARNGR